MAEVLLAVLMTVALFVLAGWAIHGIAHLDGKGSAPAPGSPAEPHPFATRCPHGIQFLDECEDCAAESTRLPIRHAACCGAYGPADLQCDLPPHDGYRHEQDGMGWTAQGGPVLRPAHLGEWPKAGER